LGVQKLNNADDVLDLGKNTGKSYVPFNGMQASQYHWIRESRKPETREFKKWLAREVIPSIRKTGKYQIDDQENLTREFLDNLATLFPSIKLMSYQSKRFACIL
jgi:hypothetical protein